MIPKTIHYVWVGGKPMGKLQKQCLESWRQYLSGYTFKLWDESNLPREVLEHPYVRTMYAKERWAFVSDYVRFWALEREGGIYLDTDTEILKDLGDLLEHNAFFGRTKDGMVAAGVIGAISHHPVIEAILKVYDEDKEFNTKRTSPLTVTSVLDNGSYFDVVVYDYQYFNPCDDGEVCTPEKLTLAYANNHWAESWVPFSKIRKILRRIGIMKFLKSFHAKT